ncbi:hypothetical protein PILCRDRAFT_8711 [Piloderma croceum F 1598]|uniref:Uncharacterized protein n=1 Tax=Piloderma croceum (strain F 1598) TaxID=765440 RepID=A0A0C3F9L2_PILCF|nr:hypothetical protein PILCRDRAFT_8711 [Piloderma croceum F 1598]
MSIPNPVNHLNTFLEHIKSLGLNLAVTTFTHYQNQPFHSPGHRYDERSTQEWCECMDSLLSKLTHIMGSDPTHQEIVTTVIRLCSDSITQFEGILKAQIESDKAAFEEMEKVKEKVGFAKEAAKEAVAEATRFTVEHAKKERERFAVMAQDDPNTISTKCAWSDTQDMGDDNDDKNENDEEEEDGDDWAGEEGTDKKTKCNLEREARSKLLQRKHDVQKKSCSNGSCCHPRKVQIKEEPKSPKSPRNPMKAHRVYSTSNANPIRVMDILDINTEPT